MIKAVIYARYSSDSQTEQSIEGQLRVCKEFAERNGYVIVKEYIDIDVDLKTLAEDMTRVGNEYDSAEKLINATNLTVGEVLENAKYQTRDQVKVPKVVDEDV